MPNPSSNWIDRRLRKSPDFAFRRVEDESILLPIRANVIEDSQLFALNPTGTRVWELIDGTRTAQEISGLIADEFDADPKQITNDVTAFVSTLVNVGGVEVENAE